MVVVVTRSSSSERNWMQFGAFRALRLLVILWSQICRERTVQLTRTLCLMPLSCAWRRFVALIRRISNKRRSAVSMSLGVAKPTID